MSSGHGGAREGASRKSKYTDYKGQPLETKKVWIPKILTEEDIRKLAQEKTKPK